MSFEECFLLNRISCDSARGPLKFPDEKKPLWLILFLRRILRRFCLDLLCDLSKGSRVMTDDLPKDELETMIPDDSFAIEEEEISAEAWKDEPPLEDGFNDPDVPVENYSEETLAQEEFVEEAPVEETLYQDPPADHNRGKVVLLGLVVFGVLFIGGLAYLQLSSSGSTEESVSSLVNMADVQQQAPATGQPAAAPADSQISPTTAETDLALLYQAAKKQAPSSTVALPGEDVKDETAESKEELTKSSDIVMLNNDVRQKIDLSTKPKEEVQEPPKEAPQIAKIETIPVKPAGAKGEVEPQPVMLQKMAETASSGLDEKLAGAEKTIESLRAETALMQEENKKLAARVKELEVASAEKPDAVPVADENAAKLQEMEKLLEEKERELQAAATEVTRFEAKNNGLLKELEILRKKVAQAETKEKEPVVAKPKAEKRIAKSQPAKKTAKVATPLIKKEKKVDAPVVEGMVLRAATPDAAWVAENKTTIDLKRVAIGDYLPKIGQITQIRYKDGGWELVGSSGVLR
jgi:hypothetical protein